MSDQSNLPEVAWSIDTLTADGLVRLVEENRRLTEQVAWYVEERKEMARQVGIHDPTGVDHMEEMWAAASERDDATMAVRAFMALALRLWCDDGPDETGTIASINEWAYNLPEQERAALNAMLGENFGGKGPNWDHDHPVCNLVRRLTDEDGQ